MIVKHTSATSPSAQAAREERVAAKYMDLRSQVYTLGLAVLSYIAYLFLPHAGGARGFEVLLRLPAAQEVGISIVENVFVYLLTIGVGVLTTLVIFTRRAVFGLVGWMMSTVGFVINILVFWMRGSQPEEAQIGMYVAAVAAGLAFFGYSLVALRRSPEQQEAERRARDIAGQLDEVGQVQAGINQAPAPERNPLLIDDRRAQAHERNARRNREARS